MLNYNWGDFGGGPDANTVKDPKTGVVKTVPGFGPSGRILHFEPNSHLAALRKIESDIPRYGVYADRFATAIEKVDLGDRSFVTNPRADSIHNIWFEFHEDILAVVGRPRETVEDVH